MQTYALYRHFTKQHLQQLVTIVGIRIRRAIFPNISLRRIPWRVVGWSIDIIPDRHHSINIYERNIRMRRSIGFAPCHARNSGIGIRILYSRGSCPHRVDETP